MKFKHTPIGRIVDRVTEPLRNSIYNGYFNNDDKKASSRRNILIQNISFNIVATLTGGIFLTGLILYILRNEPESIQNDYLGLVVTAQLLANFFQIFTPFITARLKSYRWLMFLSRLFYFLFNIVGLAVIPMLNISAISQAKIFTALIFLIQLSVAMVNPAVCAWHITNIPNDKRADWMSIQQMILPIVNTVSSLIASFVIDKFELAGHYMAAVLLLRGFMLLFAFFELRTHFIIKEPKYEHTDDTISFKSIIIEPLRCKPFMMTVLIVCLWQIVANLPGQYFNAYLLNNLNISYTYINLCTATNIPLMLLFMPIWNKVVHKKGWLWTLGLSTTIYFVPYILNCLMFKETYMLYLVSIIYCNIVSPGINLCFANLVYVKMPEGKSTSCIAFYNAAAGAIACASSYLGKTFIKFTENITIPLGSHNIVNLQYICIIAMIFVLLTGLASFELDKKDKQGKL